MKLTAGRAPAAQAVRKSLAGWEIGGYFVPHSAVNGISEK